MLLPGETLYKNLVLSVCFRANYNVSIPQDTLLDSTITRISATDVDEGDNQKVSNTTYEVILTTMGTKLECV